MSKLLLVSRYPFHKSGGWLFHLFVWCFQSLCLLAFFGFPDTRLVESLGFILAPLPFELIFAYVNLWLLFPRYLLPGRYLWFLVGNLLLCTIVIVPCTFVLSFLDAYFPPELLVGEVAEATTPPQYLIDATLIVVFGSSLPMLAILLRDQLSRDRQDRARERERITNELEFLKQQLNPHFLFNSINSIFHLIDEDTEQAKEYLAELSEILRYTLYETSNELVPLQREMQHVHRLAKLEKLRRGRRLDVTIEEAEGLGYVEIVPLIILTFLENAFKHVSTHFDRANLINLRLHRAEDRLHLELWNTVGDTQADSPTASGIGLANIRKRLQLLYPDRHELTIDHSAGRFSVSLLLQTDSA